MSSQRATVALYPGSFDPVTLGHEDIARRGLKLADRVVVAVAESATQTKRTRFSVDERLDMLKRSFEEEPSITAERFSGLLVDFARAQNAQLVIRGLRAVSDFEYEFQMAQMNRALMEGLETVFLTPHHDYAFLSASLVREVARLGGDVSPFVSPHVLQALQE